MLLLLLFIVQANQKARIDVSEVGKYISSPVRGKEYFWCHNTQGFIFLLVTSPVGHIPSLIRASSLNPNNILHHISVSAPGLKLCLCDEKTYELKLS